MLLQDVLRQPLTALQEMECYVNDGSPSGFSTENTTSRLTSPFGKCERFRLSILGGSRLQLREYGRLPDLRHIGLNGDAAWLLVHPDMTPFVAERLPAGCYLRPSSFDVLPTASGRTVQVVSEMSRDYVKLHYGGILGRIRRDLSYFKAIAGPEVSAILGRAVATKAIPADLSYFPEPCARIVSLDGEVPVEWGMVWRIGAPHGAIAERIAYIVPAFSLFSRDRRRPRSAVMLSQIIAHVGMDAAQYVYSVLLEPLVRCYFSAIMRTGLQPEWNAQNVLFGFARDLRSAQVIMRDLESVDKDLSIMRDLGMATDLDSAPYKCIERSQYNYCIKHSFMYDFKLGESVIGPLIDAISARGTSTANEMMGAVRECAAQYIRDLPRDFFPRGKWFAFRRELVNQDVASRPYVEMGRPRFRDR